MESRSPILNGHRPFFLDILQGQREQLVGGFLARESGAIFDNFAQRHIHRLNRVRRVDDFSNFCRIGKHPTNPLPMRPPAFDDGRIFFAPAGRKFIQCLARRRFVRGVINLLQVSRDRLAFPDEVQTVADQMHEAQLSLCVWKDRRECFGQIFESIHGGH